MSHPEELPNNYFDICPRSSLRGTLLEVSPVLLATPSTDCSEEEEEEEERHAGLEPGYLSLSSSQQPDQWTGHTFMLSEE